MNIKEISQNYDITPHTLRYYEKIGLIKPDYLDNGYRDYSYAHIQQLNTIRDLRSFDIPLDQIKNYLDNKERQLTKEMLQFELHETKKQIKGLQEKKVFLQERIKLIEEVEAVELMTVSVKLHKEQQIILSQTENVSGKELYLELKKLHKQFAVALHGNNQNVFGTILKNSQGEIKHQVFYCVNGKPKSYSTTIQAGCYASIHYGGTYKKRDQALDKLKEVLKQRKLLPIGPFYEFYLLDFHETNIESEYVTRIDVQVRAEQEGN